jgi:hypothetical protein
MYMHIYIYTYSFAWKVGFDRLLYTFIALLCLISCYGSLFSLLDTQGVTVFNSINRGKIICG